MKPLILITYQITLNDYVGLISPGTNFSCTLLFFGISRIAPKKISLIISILNVFYGVSEVYYFDSIKTCNTLTTYIRADNYMIIHIYLLSSPKFLENIITWILIVFLNLGV
jgi:hypothetical protein